MGKHSGTSRKSGRNRRYAEYEKISDNQVILRGAVFKSHQEALQHEYSENPVCNEERSAFLSRELNIPARNIGNWFKRRCEMDQRGMCTIEELRIKSMSRKFTEKQKEILLEFYNKNPSGPSVEDVEYLERRTGLSGVQVRSWLSNYRKRHRELEPDGGTSSTTKMKKDKHGHGNDTEEEEDDDDSDIDVVGGVDDEKIESMFDKWSSAEMAAWMDGSQKDNDVDDSQKDVSPTVNTLVDQFQYENIQAGDLQAGDLQAYNTSADDFQEYDATAEYLQEFEITADDSHADVSQDGAHLEDPPPNSNGNAKTGEIVEIEISPENLVLLEEQFQSGGRYCQGKRAKELQQKTNLPEKVISKWLKIRKIRADDLLLTEAFERNPFPTTKEMLSLMNCTRFTSVNKIENWFEAQRQKGKKKRCGRPKKSESRKTKATTPIRKHVAFTGNTYTNSRLSSRRQRMQGKFSGSPTAFQKNMEGQDQDSSANSSSVRINPVAGLDRIVMKQEALSTHVVSPSAASSNQLATKETLSDSPVALSTANANTPHDESVEQNSLLEPQLDFSSSPVPSNDQNLQAMEEAITELDDSSLQPVPAGFTEENPPVVDQEVRCASENTPSTGVSPPIVEVAEPNLSSDTQQLTPSTEASIPNSPSQDVVSEDLAAQDSMRVSEHVSDIVLAAEPQDDLPMTFEAPPTQVSPLTTDLLVGEEPAVAEEETDVESRSPSPAPTYMTRRSMLSARVDEETMPTASDAPQNAESSAAPVAKVPSMENAVKPLVRTSKGFPDSVKQIMIDFHDHVRTIPRPEDLPELERKTGLRDFQIKNWLKSHRVLLKKRQMRGEHVDGMDEDQEDEIGLVGGDNSDQTDPPVSSGVVETKARVDDSQPCSSAQLTFNDFLNHLASTDQNRSLVTSAPASTDVASESDSDEPAPKKYPTRASIALSKTQLSNANEIDPVEEDVPSPKNTGEKETTAPKGFSTEAKKIMINFHDNVRTTPLAHDFPDLQRATGLTLMQIRNFLSYHRLKLRMLPKTKKKLDAPGRESDARKDANGMNMEENEEEEEDGVRNNDNQAELPLVAMGDVETEARVQASQDVDSSIDDSPTEKEKDNSLAGDSQANNLQQELRQHSSAAPSAPPQTIGLAQSADAPIPDSPSSTRNQYCMKLRRKTLEATDSKKKECVADTDAEEKEDVADDTVPDNHGELPLAQSASVETEPFVEAAHDVVTSIGDSHAEKEKDDSPPVDSQAGDPQADDIEAPVNAVFNVAHQPSQVIDPAQSVNAPISDSASSTRNQYCMKLRRKTLEATDSKKNKESVAATDAEERQVDVESYDHGELPLAQSESVKMKPRVEVSQDVVSSIGDSHAEKEKDDSPPVDPQADDIEAPVNDALNAAHQQELLRHSSATSSAPPNVIDPAQSADAPIPDSPSSRRNQYCMKLRRKTLEATDSKKKECVADTDAEEREDAVDDGIVSDEHGELPLTQSESVQTDPRVEVSQDVDSSSDPQVEDMEVPVNAAPSQVAGLAQSTDAPILDAHSSTRNQYCMKLRRKTLEATDSKKKESVAATDAEEREDDVDDDVELDNHGELPLAQLETVEPKLSVEVPSPKNGGEKATIAPKGFSDQAKKIMINFHDNVRTTPLAHDFPDLQRATGLTLMQIRNFLSYHRLKLRMHPKTKKKLDAPERESDARRDGDGTNMEEKEEEEEDGVRNNDNQAKLPLVPLGDIETEARVQASEDVDSSIDDSHAEKVKDDNNSQVDKRVPPTVDSQADDIEEPTNNALDAHEQELQRHSSTPSSTASEVIDPEQSADAPKPDSPSSTRNQYCMKLRRKTLEATDSRKKECVADTDAEEGEDVVDGDVVSDDHGELPFAQSETVETEPRKEAAQEVNTYVDNAQVHSGLLPDAIHSENALDDPQAPIDDGQSEALQSASPVIMAPELTTQEPELVPDVSTSEELQDHQSVEVPVPENATEEVIPPVVQSTPIAASTVTPAELLAQREEETLIETFPTSENSSSKSSPAEASSVESDKCDGMPTLSVQQGPSFDYPPRDSQGVETNSRDESASSSTLPSILPTTAVNDSTPSKCSTKVSETMITTIPHVCIRNEVEPAVNVDSSSNPTQQEVSFVSRGIASTAEQSITIQTKQTANVAETVLMPKEAPVTAASSPAETTLDTASIPSPLPEAPSAPAISPVVQKKPAQLVASKRAASSSVEVARKHAHLEVSATIPPTTDAPKDGSGSSTQEMDSGEPVPSEDASEVSDSTPKVLRLSKELKALGRNSSTFVAAPIINFDRPTTRKQFAQQQTSKKTEMSSSSRGVVSRKRKEIGSERTSGNLAKKIDLGPTAPLKPQEETPKEPTAPVPVQNKRQFKDCYTDEDEWYADTLASLGLPPEEPRSSSKPVRDPKVPSTSGFRIVSSSKFGAIIHFDLKNVKAAPIVKDTSSTSDKKPIDESQSSSSTSPQISSELSSSGTSLSQETAPKVGDAKPEEKKIGDSPISSQAGSTSKDVESTSHEKSAVPDVNKLSSTGSSGVAERSEQAAGCTESQEVGSSSQETVLDRPSSSESAKDPAGPSTSGTSTEQATKIPRVAEAGIKKKKKKKKKKRPAESSQPQQPSSGAGTSSSQSPQPIDQNACAQEPQTNSNTTQRRSIASAEERKARLEEARRLFGDGPLPQIQRLYPDDPHSVPLNDVCLYEIEGEEKDGTFVLKKAPANAFIPYRIYFNRDAESERLEALRPLLPSQQPPPQSPLQSPLQPLPQRPVRSTRNQNPVN